MPELEIINNNPLIEFDVNEKELVDEELIEEEDILTEAEPIVTEMPLSVNDTFAQKIADGLELEIKPTEKEDDANEMNLDVHPTAEIEEENEAPLLDDVEPNEMDETALEVRSDELATINYDPTLDLRDYKYQSCIIRNTW
jgi:hypothetical protein